MYQVQTNCNLLRKLSIEFSVNEIAGTVCSMSGKFFTSICLTTTSVYTGEMFPTLLRSTSVGVSSMSARFGAATVPFLVFTGAPFSLFVFLHHKQ